VLAAHRVIAGEAQHAGAVEQLDDRPEVARAELLEALPGLPLDDQVEDDAQPNAR
jgi:hypothetical protein